MADSNTTTVEQLEKHIQALNDLFNAVQALRQIPSSLFRSLPRIMPTNVVTGQLKDVSARLRSDTVQTALRTARNSEISDRSDLSTNPRRETRKRQRPPSPASPQPYISPNRTSSSLFPGSDEDRLPLRIDQLPDFIKDFNRSHSCKLHIWLRTKHETRQRSIVTLRFSIPDVLIAYVTVNASYEKYEGHLITENIIVFSPREKKAPHSQSDYVVYQTLSQHLAKMLQSDPCVSFRAVVGLLYSYEDLFVARCSRCGLVLSKEGHVPPVARLWVEAEGEGQGKWAPRHVMCRLPS